MLHGIPWVSTYSYCHQMITQQQPKGPERLLEVTRKLRFFSQTRGAPMGGQYPEIALGTPIVG